jgi:hypothetical protein
VEEFGRVELFRKSEEGHSGGGDEVDLLGKSDAGVVLDDSKGLVHTSGEVERVPVEEVGAEIIDGGDAVFDGLCIIVREVV